MSRIWYGKVRYGKIKHKSRVLRFWVVTDCKIGSYEPKVVQSTLGDNIKAKVCLRSGQATSSAEHRKGAKLRSVDI